MPHAHGRGRSSFFRYMGPADFAPGRRESTCARIRTIGLATVTYWSGPKSCTRDSSAPDAGDRTGRCQFWMDTSGNGIVHRSAPQPELRPHGAPPPGRAKTWSRCRKKNELADPRVQPSPLAKAYAAADFPPRAWELRVVAGSASANARPHRVHANAAWASRPTRPRLASSRPSTKRRAVYALEGTDVAGTPLPRQHMAVIAHREPWRVKA